MSPLLYFAFPFQNQVHGADRAEVALFIQEGCIELARRLVHKAVFMEKGEDLAPFRRRKGEGRLRTDFSCGGFFHRQKVARGRPRALKVLRIPTSFLRRATVLMSSPRWTPSTDRLLFLDFNDQFRLVQLVGKFCILRFQFCTTAGTGISCVSDRSSLLR